MTASYFPVYPRWRGEHDVPELGEMAEAGLSPLARGTLVGDAIPLRNCRFIPAGAGNTYSYPEAVLKIPVYPRWRGEHGPAG